MPREKRALELDQSNEEMANSDPKRSKVPALASGIVEALKVDSLQRLCSSLEPILRRVVSEEVERALAKLGPARLGGGRSPPKQIKGSDGRNLQLHFKSRVSLPLFTGGKVEGEQGAAIHVVLVDANTGHVMTSGSESSTKLDLVVLEGDFNNEDKDGWTEEEFESHIVKEREGKRPLLTGDLQISLKEGVGTLGELTFTDNSSWIRSRKFRLGMKVTSGFCEGIRVREAKTEAFTVKDHRGELYKKHYPPALKDEVWRLEKIGKDGSFHKRLNKSGIYKVEDFLRLVVRDSQRLRSILGSGMSNKMWDNLVEHAKTCMLSGKHYIYYSDDSRSIGAIFNNIYEFSGLIAGGQFYTANCLADNQKVFVDTLVKKAYDNWMHVVEYDGKALLNLKQNKKAMISPNKNLTVSANYPSSSERHVSQTQLSFSTASVSTLKDTGSAVEGYTVNQVSRYLTQTQPQQLTTSARMQYHETSNIPQNQFIGSANTTLVPRMHNMSLALGPPQQHISEFQPIGRLVQSNLNSNEDWSHQRNTSDIDFFTEEDIRMRSNEILENEDMQHLLRVFSMGRANGYEDGYEFPACLPSPNITFEEERSRPSGKAVVGWLKIKAAMRWGIFIRKQAAERRAQLIELDD